MSRNPAENNAYDREYYQSHCGIENYVNNEDMVKIFENIASEIINIFHPETVLDVGCACGYLVAALRDMGVSAYGVDTSDYALSEVPSEYRSWVAELTLPEKKLPNSFPAKFDLVTNIEVLEHIPEELAEESIKVLTELSDTVVFSSSPSDFAEPTHVNVRPLSYWCRIFAKFGFFSDVELAKKLTVSPQVMVFRKTDKPISDELTEKTLLMYEDKLSVLAVERLNIIQSLQKTAAEVAGISARLQEQEKIGLERLDIIRDLQNAEKITAANHSAEVAGISARLQEQEKIGLERLDIIRDLQRAEKVTAANHVAELAGFSARLQEQEKLNLERLNIIRELQSTEMKRAEEAAALSANLRQEKELNSQRLDIIANMQRAEKLTAADHAAEISGLATRLQEQEKLSLERLDIIKTLREAEKLNTLKRTRKVARLSAILQKTRAEYDNLAARLEENTRVFESKSNALHEEITATMQILAAQTREFRQLAEAHAGSEQRVAELQNEAVQLRQINEMLTAAKEEAERLFREEQSKAAQLGSAKEEAERLFCEEQSKAVQSGEQSRELGEALGRAEQELALIKSTRSYRLARFINKFRHR